MKVHIGVDSQSGLVHSASVTAANVHDSQQSVSYTHLTLPTILRV